MNEIVLIAVDVQVAGAAARKAELEAAQQNLSRYTALEAFKRIVAPFDGVVTSRQTDVGDYVNAGGGDAGARSTATELFRVADVHALLVYVSVPEDYARALVPGPTASLHLPTSPEKTFTADGGTFTCASGHKVPPVISLPI